jgi:hypothetical protein
MKGEDDEKIINIVFGPRTGIDGERLAHQSR